MAIVTTLSVSGRWITDAKGNRVKLQFAPGDRAGYGLFAQDWAGVSNRALLEALQAIQRPATGPGV